MVSLFGSSTTTSLSSLEAAGGPSVVDRRKPGRSFAKDGMSSARKRHRKQSMPRCVKRNDQSRGYFIVKYKNLIRLGLGESYQITRFSAETETGGLFSMERERYGRKMVGLRLRKRSSDATNVGDLRGLGSRESTCDTSAGHLPRAEPDFRSVPQAGGCSIEKEVMPQDDVRPHTSACIDIVQVSGKTVKLWW